jgi:hypothetical protein
MKSVIWLGAPKSRGPLAVAQIAIPKSGPGHFFGAVIPNQLRIPRICARNGQKIQKNSVFKRFFQ